MSASSWNTASRGSALLPGGVRRVSALWAVVRLKVIQCSLQLPQRLQVELLISMFRLTG
jgi:hypothetical protein